MRYLKLFENFYVGAVYVADKGNPDELNNTIAFPYRKHEYNDENEAFDKGFKSFKSGEINPYIDEEFPNANLVKAWENGYNTAKRNKETYEN